MNSERASPDDKLLTSKLGDLLLAGRCNVIDEAIKIIIECEGGRTGRRSTARAWATLARLLPDLHRRFDEKRKKLQPNDALLAVIADLKQEADNLE